MNDIKAFADKLCANVGKVIVGKSRAIHLVLIAILCEGHVLIDDVPGVGKTMLARSISKSLGLLFRRIQFTPDLLPSDILGVNVYNQKTGEFEFKPGPILSHVVLADEINRGTPKTQSALLECMEERQVSLDHATHPVPRPFLVIATENPIEHQGTFPLPEAQVDRFFIRVHLGYPTPEEEGRIVTGQKLHHPIETLQPVISKEDLLSAQQRVREVHVDKSLQDYLVDLVARTRLDDRLLYGASPRGSLALYKAAQAQAAIEGRDYVIPDDIKGLVPPVLAHRLISRAARTREHTEAILTDILSASPVPA